MTTTQKTNRFDLFVGPGLGLLLGLVVFNVWQNVASVSQVYQLRQLQNQTDQLQKENEILAAERLKTDSLNNLSLQVAALGMEEVNKIQFVSSAGTARAIGSIKRLSSPVSP